MHSYDPCNKIVILEYMDYQRGKVMKNYGEENKDFWFTILRAEDPGAFWHLELEIIFILKGTGRVCFENTQSAYELNEGDIFTVNSFQLRILELDKEAQAISLMISPHLLFSISSETMQGYIDCRSFLYGDDRQENFDILRRDFANVFSQQNKSEYGRSIYLKSKIAVLLENLTRLFLDDSKSSFNGSGRERLKSAVDYIQHHYKENIKLSDLEDQTYLSSSYISHSFQKYLGMSFKTYLTQIRLAQATLLLHGDRTITEVASESGFSTINSLIKAFNQYKGMSPGEYRRRLKKEGRGDIHFDNGAEDGISDVFSTLMRYADDSDTHTGENSPQETVLAVSVDMNSKKQRLSMHWKRLINAGYSKNLVNGTLQEEIRRIQQDIGFEYIRCKGILDDDMCLYRKYLIGNPVVNYHYIDEVIDFILSVHAKPMLELSHMPSIMAKHKTMLSMRSLIISIPEDMDLWETLIYNLVSHLNQRYGTANVKKWLFSLWALLDYENLNYITMEEYSLTYQAAYRAVKSVCSDFLICGPGCENYKKYLPWYIKMCRENHCMPDVLTFRSFATVAPEEEKDELKLWGNGESLFMSVSDDEDILFHSVQNIRRILKQEHLENMPVIVEEWSNNIWQKDYCNDTCYKSAFIFKGILENNEHLNGIGYFSINDRLEEAPPSGELYHGGFGLFTRNNIPKSGYSAMKLLSQMGEYLIQKGKGYYITESDHEIQVFLYNYCHYDMLYRYRHTVNMSKTDRYQVFNRKDSCVINIQLDHMDPGTYVFKHYSISPAGGSSYDAWIQMGAPDTPDSEELLLLNNLSQPSYKTWQTELLPGKSSLNIKAGLLPHEVQLFKIFKK